MLRRGTIASKGLLVKGLSVVLLGIIVGSVGTGASFAASKKNDPAACRLSQNAAGDLIASGTGLTSTGYQYEMYSAPQASVGGGQLSTDASGNFSADLGPTSFYMSVYPNETTLTFDLYPIVGNKADMNIVVASCSITP
jgi:hypothetical protein